MPTNDNAHHPATARRGRAVGLLAATAALGVLAPTSADAAELSASPSNLASVFSAAQGGDTIRLAAGNYGTFSGGSKPSTVTLAPQSGAAVSMSLNLKGADHIAIDGATVTGATLDGAHDIAITNSRFTGPTTVNASRTGANIVFDRDVFDGIDACSTCGEGRVTVRGYNNDAPVGVTISNSHFGNGGASDGIQIIGGANGVQVGPGNEFSGLRQGGNTVHVDPIQLYGSSHTLITGNYFHDNSTGVMTPDGGDSEVIENNVFVMDEYPWAVMASHIPGIRMRHNAVLGGSLHVDDATNPGSSSRPTTGTITDNAGGVSLGAHGAIDESYNVFKGAAGGRDINVAPRFAGGAKPSTYAGFVLAAGSPGAGAASDGKDMGIVLPAAPAPAAAAPAPAPATAPARAPQPNSSSSALSLAQPLAGARFTWALRFGLSGATGVDRVGYWFDGRWVRTVRKAPYAARWRVPRSTRFGRHSAATRVFGTDGSVRSIGVTVRRVHQRGAKAAAQRRMTGWTLATAPSAGGTRLTGRGVPRHRVRVSLAVCGDRRARVAVRRIVRASRSGRISAVSKRPDLCVLKLRQ